MDIALFVQPRQYHHLFNKKTNDKCFKQTKNNSNKKTYRYISDIFI